jgi:hypothetical protein
MTGTPTASSGEFTELQFVPSSSDLSYVVSVQADARTAGMTGEDPRFSLACFARGLVPSSSPNALSQELPAAPAAFTSVFPDLRGISSTSKMLSVRIDAFVVRWELCRSNGSLGDESISIYEIGMRGTSGTDDRRLMAFPLGGLGNMRVTFSSNVMLLVSLGCGLAGIVALLGRVGRGGSCVGLPGDEASRDFLPITDPPDLVLL